MSVEELHRVHHTRMISGGKMYARVVLISDSIFNFFELELAGYLTCWNKLSHPRCVPVVLVVLLVIYNH